MGLGNYLGIAGLVAILGGAGTAIYGYKNLSEISDKPEIIRLYNFKNARAANELVLKQYEIGSPKYNLFLKGRDLARVEVENLEQIPEIKESMEEINHYAKLFLGGIALSGLVTLAFLAAPPLPIRFGKKSQTEERG